MNEIEKESNTRVIMPYYRVTDIELDKNITQDAFSHKFFFSDEHFCKCLALISRVKNDLFMYWYNNEVSPIAVVVRKC